MSTTTKNLGLLKPDLNDAADITAMNSNWDKLDEQLSDMSTDSIVEQNKRNDQKFWVGTKAEYDSIRTKDPNTSYTVTDEEDNDITPMENGGTGASNGADGLKNLFASGNTVLSSYQYGNTLPNAGVSGRIFFKVVE